MKKILLSKYGGLIGIQLVLNEYYELKVWLDQRQHLVLLQAKTTQGKLAIFPTGSLYIQEIDTKQGFSLSYNQKGKISQLGKLAFLYENNGRLKQLGSLKFAYGAGGRLAKIGENKITYRFDGRLKKIGALVLKYRAEGRIKLIGETQFVYAPNGRLKAIGAFSLIYNNITNNIQKISGKSSFLSLLLFWKKHSLKSYLRLP